MYQDVVDESGKTLVRGYRECASRYEVIRDYVATLRRPFTVLDLGASAGYFSIQLTRDFGARCICVEPSPDIEHARDQVAAIVRSKVMPEDVRKLGTFDVVLGLSVLHHMTYWQSMLAMLDRIARSALIIETPNAEEKLRKAVVRNNLGSIIKLIEKDGFTVIGETPSVWDRRLVRPMYAKRRSGISTRGTVFSGSGQNGMHLSRSQDDLENLLGYRPFLGSLNLKTKYAFRLGAYAMEFVDARGRGGRRGGDYQVWHARIDGYDGPAHVMRPGSRTHGRYVLEVWAPVNLREHLDLQDGSTVTLRIGA